jgi:phosphate transport system protein
MQRGKDYLMHTAEILPSIVPVYNELVQITLVACELARQSATATCDALGARSLAAIATITDCERKLDLLDREIDERVGHAVTIADVGTARELLVCMKFLIDLERVGDLLSSVASRVQMMDHAVEMSDVRDLIEMSTVLEAMLRKAHIGFENRDVNAAIDIARSDAEIDRRRNLLFVRLLDGASTTTRNGVHILFIANAVERAGDHVVNLGEEICHIVTGHSMRHVRIEKDKPCEQQYLDFLRRHAVPSAGINNPKGSN